MSALNTPSRVPFRDVLNLTPSNRSYPSTPKTSPGPALLQAIYLSNSKKITSPRNLDKNVSVDKANGNKNVVIDPNNHNVPYFRNLISTETDRLTNLCTKWENLIPDITEFFEKWDKSDELGFVLGDLRTVVGQARLIMEQRFKQFNGLVDNCEFNSGEKPITCEDLQGFWDMIYFQVEDVDAKFEKLQKRQKNSWKPCEEDIKSNPTVVTKKRKVVKKPAAKPSAAVIAKRQEMARKRLEARKRLQAAKEALEISSNTPQKKATVTFDAGFFKVESPIKFGDDIPQTSKENLSDKKQLSIPETSKSNLNEAPPAATQSRSPDVPRKLNFSQSQSVDAQDEEWPNNLPTSPDPNTRSQTFSSGQLKTDLTFVSTEVQTSPIKSQANSCQTETSDTTNSDEPLEKMITRLLHPETNDPTSEDEIDAASYKEHYYRLLAKVKLLEMRLNAVHDMFDEISSTKQNIQNTSNLLSKWNQKLKLEKEDLTKREANLISNDQFLKQSLNEANEKISYLEVTATESNNQNAILSQTNENLSSANLCLSDENQQLKSLNEEINEKLKQLQLETTKNRNETCGLQKEISSLNMQLNDERELSEKMKQVIDHSEEVFGNMSNDIKALNGTISSLKEENISLIKEVHSLNEKNHDLNERIETLSYVEDEFKSLEEQFNEQEQKLQTSNRQVEELNEKLSETTKRCAEAERVLKETQETLEESKKEIDYVKAYSNVRNREKVEAISYSESGMKHVYKMMSALNQRLIGLLGKEMDSSQSEEPSSDSELPEDIALPSLIEHAEQMMQCVINTCAEVQCHYKETINILNIQINALQASFGRIGWLQAKFEKDVYSVKDTKIVASSDILNSLRDVMKKKVVDLKMEVQEKKDNDNECIGMLRRRVLEVMRERDEKDELLEKYIHDSTRMNDQLARRQFNPVTKLDNLVLGSASRPQLNSFFTPRRTRRRRSSSVSDLKSIQW